MKCENEEVELFINDSVQLIETAEHKNYFRDTLLHDAEIIDLGVALSPEEDPSYDFEEKTQEEATSPARFTSPSRRKDRSSSIEVIDLDTYAPKDKTENVDKVIVKKEKMTPNTSKDDSDDVIEICEVGDSSTVIASKGRKKRLSYEEEIKQALQQRNQNKPFDIKKNQGFIGMKIQPLEVNKQNQNKSNTENKSVSKEKERKNRRVRVTKEKRSQNQKIAQPILTDNNKKESQLQDEKKIDKINTEKIKHYSISTLLNMKKNLLKEFEKLDSTLDVNKNILKPSKVDKNFDDKTLITDVAILKSREKVTHNKSPDQKDASNKIETLKNTSKNVDKNNKNNSSISVTSYFFDKKTISIEEYKKTKEKTNTFKIDTIQDKEEDNNVNKPTTSQNNFQRQTPELQNPNTDRILTVDENNKEKENNDATEKDAAKHEEENNEINKSTTIKDETQRQNVDNKKYIEKCHKETKNSDDIDENKEQNKEINKPSTSKNKAFKVTSEPQKIQKENPKHRPNLIKPSHQTISKTKSKEKSSTSFHLCNRFTENVKERIRKLQQNTNKNEIKNILNKNPNETVSLSQTVSEARETHSQNDTKENVTAKPVEPEMVETPNVSINVNYTSDNRITIEIVNTSPKVPKPLVIDQQVQKHQVSDTLTTKTTPKSQASEVLMTQSIAQQPLLDLPVLESSVLIPSESEQLVNNLSVSKQGAPMSMLRKQRLPSKSSESHPPVLNKIAPKPTTFNTQEPRAQTPKSQTLPTLGNQELSNSDLYIPRTPIAPKPVSNPPMSKSLTPEPLLKPSSKSTLNPVETSEMIEKAVYEYKMREYYAQKEEMRINAPYVSIPVDYTVETIRLANIPQHPPPTASKKKKSKKPVKILSVEEVSNLYMPNQQNCMHREPFAPTALKNMSKLVHSVSAMQQQYPIQRLVTERKNTGHQNIKQNIMHYYNPATPVAKIKAQQMTNAPRVIDPRFQMEPFGRNAPCNQNISCMPQGFPDTRPSFPTQQNINGYQPPNNYVPYDFRYCPPEMRNYFPSMGYNIPSQSSYYPSMGGPMYPGKHPPPYAYPTQQSMPDRIPLTQDESIIGKNNEGVVKKINITNPYKDVKCNHIQPNEPLKQELKKDNIQNEIYNDKAKTRQENPQYSNITPVSTKIEMLRELDSSIEINKTEVPLPVKNKTLKRPYESSVVKEENKAPKYIPCPLSKKMKQNDLLRTPERNEHQIIKNKMYSPPILPIPPNYENYFSMSKLEETKSASKESKTPTNSSSEGLADLLQLSDKDLSKVLAKSGYTTKRMK